MVGKGLKSCAFINNSPCIILVSAHYVLMVIQTYGNSKYIYVHLLHKHMVLEAFEGVLEAFQGVQEAIEGVFCSLCTTAYATTTIELALHREKLRS